MLPILKSATRGLSLLSDWNTEIALRAPKSVPMGWYLTELVLKGIHRVHAANFEMSHQVAKFFLWLKRRNGTQWAQISLNGLIFGWVGLERYKQSPFNWFCNQPQAGWVIKWLKLAPIGPKSVQMGCNLLVLELVLKLIGRVQQTDFVISHQWIESILVTETQKWHLQSPNQTKWAVIWLNWCWWV